MTSQILALGLVGGLVAAEVPQKIQTKTEIFATKASIGAIARTIHLHAAVYDGEFNTNDMSRFVQQEMRRQDGQRSDLDAWGNPLQFTTNGRYVVVISAGPDKTIGNSDDIKRRIDILNY